MNLNTDLLAAIYAAHGITAEADESRKVAALESGLREVKDHIRRTAPSVYASEFAWRNSMTETNDKPTCPRCGSTDLMTGAPVDGAMDHHWQMIRVDKLMPFADDGVRCSCGLLWHPSDLIGERFEFLKAQYARNAA